MYRLNLEMLHSLPNLLLTIFQQLWSELFLFQAMVM
jgi:hypothetical protein